MTMGRISETLGGIAVVLALLGLWSLVTAFGLVSPVFLPPVGDILRALVDLAEDGSLARAVIGTGGRMLLGFGLASLVGCGLGLLTGLSLRARAYVEPSLEFLARPFMSFGGLVDLVRVRVVPARRRARCGQEQIQKPILQPRLRLFHDPLALGRLHQ